MKIWLLTKTLKSSLLFILLLEAPSALIHNGDNYTNKLYTMIYLDDNNKVKYKEK
jgi:hypothetical protein